MTDLSPAAQAVMDAAYALPLKNGQPNIAAALRAVVNQVLPKEQRSTLGSVQPGGTRMYYYERAARWEERQLARRELLAIADELENTND